MLSIVCVLDGPLNIMEIGNGGSPHSFLDSSILLCQGSVVYITLSVVVPDIIMQLNLEFLMIICCFQLSGLRHDLGPFGDLCPPDTHDNLFSAVWDGPLFVAVCYFVPTG